MEPLVRVDGKRAWNREDWAGLGIWSSENGIKGQSMENRKVMDTK